MKVVAASTEVFGAHHVVTWLVIGLIAGALAGRVVYGRGFGCLANMAVGLAGAIIGGILLHEFGPAAITGSILDDVVVSFLGALILLGILRLITGKPPRRY